MYFFQRLGFLLCFLFSGLLLSAQQNDSLRIVLAMHDDTGKVTALNDVAYEIGKANSDSAILVSGQALRLAQDLKWQDGIGRSWHFLGLFHSSKGENRKALDYYFNAMDIWERQETEGGEEGRKRVLGHKWKTLGNIGVVYMDMGDYPGALEYFFKALKVCEAIGAKSGEAMWLGNIGVVYTEQGYADKALDYYFRSLKVEQELNNPTGIAITLGNIGSVYHDEGDYEKSLGYFRRARVLADSAGDMDGVAIWDGNIGMAYENLKMPDTALFYYFRALEIAEETGNSTTIATQLRAIGGLYADMGRYDEGEEYLMQALTMDEEAGALNDILEDEKELSELYEKSGRHALALEHYKKYTAAKDSVYSEENAAQSVREEMNYAFEKREAEHEAEQRLARLTRNFIVVLGVMLLVVITFGLRWRNNRKSLRMKEQHSHQLLLAQEKEKQRISKELHDSIGQNMLFIKNQLIKQNNTSLLQSVSDTLEEVRNISKDLYPNQLEKYGLVAAIEALAEKVQEAGGMFVSHDLSGFGRDIPSDKQINYYRIVQECVSNAVKHAEATALRITATAGGGMIELIVQDNGKGFDKQLLDAKAQTSFGMLNIEERVNYLKGKFSLETATGTGTKYVFTLPA
jgi:signal transduction histidine kinase